MTTTERTYREVLAPGADRDTWLRTRRTGIGGSDASAVASLSKYESPYSVWMDKTGRVPLDSVEASEAMLWGNLLEPVVRAEACKRLGLDVELTGTLQHADRTWQLYNPDGLLSDGGILEIKTSNQFLSGEWDDQVPDHAELQVQHGMAVTGAGHAWVAGLIGGQRLVVHRVDRDDDLIATLIDLEAAFWQHVLDDTEPPIDGHDATRAALADRYPVDPGAVRDVPPNAVAEAHANYFAAKADEKAAAERKALAANTMRALMAGRGVLTSGDRVWARTKRGVFAPKRFADEHPEIAAACTVTKTVLDTTRLKTEHPDLYVAYQATVLDPKEK